MYPCIRDKMSLENYPLWNVIASKHIVILFSGEF